MSANNNECQQNNRALYVDIFIKYMDRHPILAAIMVISFCAGMLILVGALASVLVLAVKSGNLTDLVKVIATIL